MTKKKKLETYLAMETDIHAVVLCILFLIEQLEMFDEFAQEEGYEKFTSGQVLFLRKEGRYPLLLPLFFILKDLSHKPDFNRLADIIGDLSRITDGTCFVEGETLEQVRELERDILNDCRTRLEELLGSA